MNAHEIGPLARTSERRGVWPIVLTLCGIAVAAAIRRLVALDHPSLGNGSPALALDALFAAKASLTRGHVIAGFALAVLIPVQLSTRVRARFPGIHRWLGRTLIVTGIVVGLTGYAMVAVPIGGWLEVSAIVFYGTAFLAALLTGWRYIKRGDVVRHREWMLRAVAIALGIATTRPVVGLFFATRALTGLSPSQFFGAAFWIGFTTTALAGEWYIRDTRRRRADAPVQARRPPAAVRP
jgi:uncharacterized membrane protein